MKDDDDKTDYEVGYGKPPSEHQFQKGVSGNPRGRPKGSHSWKTLIREELDEKITVFVNGKKKRITKRRALVRQAINTAITKNDPKMLTAMGAFKDDIEGSVNGLPETFSLSFENEVRQICVNGVWTLVDPPYPLDED